VHVSPFNEIGRSGSDNIVDRGKVIGNEEYLMEMK